MQVNNNDNDDVIIFLTYFYVLRNNYEVGNIVIPIL